MKLRQFFGLILISSLACLMTSCEYSEDALNGVVLIDIVKAPNNMSFINSSNTSQEIKIKFSTHTELDSVSVSLHIEDASKFDITNNVVQLKEGSFLYPITDEDNIIDFQKADLNEKEFVFETTVNLSTYPDGTCFVLFGSAEGVSDHSKGTDHKGIYFCNSRGE